MTEHEGRKPIRRSSSVLRRRHRTAHLAGVLALLALLVGLVPQAAAPALAASCETAEPIAGEARLPLQERALMAVARELPLDVKVGQLLMPGFLDTSPTPALLDRVSRGHLGGLFLLARNVRDAAQVTQLTARLDDAAADGSLGIRPWLATDFEGGTVNTLRPITGDTPSAAAMAAGGAAAAQVRGARDAGVLRSLGFNANLAPVVDVLSAQSTVIGTRSFSGDPGVVAALGRAYVRGLQGNGVLGVLKHFPGHGATADDSHVLLPTVARSLAQLEQADLVPYRQAFGAREAQAVMIGHLLVPALDPHSPATLSRPVVTGLLRDRLGFDGLVLTDELKMGAISQHFGVAEAAIMALQAGVDILLGDYTAAEQEAVLGAVRRACLAGELPAGRLERSVARVLHQKQVYGLLGPAIAARYDAHVARLSGRPVDPPPAAPAAPVPAPPSGIAVSPDQAGGQPIAGLPEGVYGRLYVEAAGGGDFGYAITDESDVPLWQGFLAFGGPDRLGYPITQRFELDGRTVQLTQRALLQWEPEGEQVTLANVFELFLRAGALLGWPGCTGDEAQHAGAEPPDCSLETWLEQKGVPPAAADSDSSGPDQDVVTTRLAWLEHERIRAAFLGDTPTDPTAAMPETEAEGEEVDGADDEAGVSAAPVPWAAIERFGLPMSRPQRYGAFIAQRFQRATLQLWLDELEGLPPPGTITQVMAGELLRDAGFAPAEALIPVDGTGAPGEPPPLPPPPTPPAPPIPVVPEAPTAVPTPAPAPTRVPTPVSTPTARPTAVSPQPTPSPASLQPTPTRSAGRGS